MSFVSPVPVRRRAWVRTQCPTRLPPSTRQSPNARRTVGSNTAGRKALSQRSVRGSSCTATSRFVSVIVKDERAPAAMARAASLRIAAHTSGRTSGWLVSTTSLADLNGRKPPRP
eukprot:scaffold262513_cov32-Tisochrysis_lutea.AAC.2